MECMTTEAFLGKASTVSWKNSWTRSCQIYLLVSVIPWSGRIPKPAKPRFTRTLVSCAMIPCLIAIPERPSVLRHHLASSSNCFRVTTGPNTSVDSNGRSGLSPSGIMELCNTTRPVITTHIEEYCGELLFPVIYPTTNHRHSAQVSSFCVDLPVM